MGIRHWLCKAMALLSWVVLWPSLCIFINRNHRRWDNSRGNEKNHWIGQVSWISILWMLISVNHIFSG